LLAQKGTKKGSRSLGPTLSDCPVLLAKNGRRRDDAPFRRYDRVAFPFLAPLLGYVKRPLIAELKQIIHSGNILLNFNQYTEVNLPETVQNLYESTVAVKGNSLFHEGALQEQISFKVQQFSG